MDTLSYCFLLALSAERPLSHLAISNVTWGNVSILWKAQESAFDSFLREVRNSDHLQETVVPSVPGCLAALSSPALTLLPVTLSTFMG